MEPDTNSNYFKSLEQTSEIEKLVETLIEDCQRLFHLGEKLRTLLPLRALIWQQTNHLKHVLTPLEKKRSLNAERCRRYRAKKRALANINKPSIFTTKGIQSDRLELDKIGLEVVRKHRIAKFDDNYDQYYCTETLTLDNQQQVITNSNSNLLESEPPNNKQNNLFQTFSHHSCGQQEIYISR